MKSDPEPALRLEKLYAVLERKKIGAAVLDRPADQFYLASYTGSDAWLILLTKKRRAILLTDPRYREEAETSAPDAETVMWKESPARHAAAILRKNRTRNAGLTMGSLSAGFYQALRDGLPAVGGWHSIEPDVMALRAVKSRKEIMAVRAALRCAQTAFMECRQSWRPGMTESEVKNDLEYRMKRLGAATTSFSTIVAAGPNASLPHAHAGKRKIQPGKMLLIDFGAEVGRYASDLTRTLWCGEMPKVWRNRYQALLEAQAAAVAGIRAGVAGCVPDRAARQVLAGYGLEDKFTHGLGHGVGLAVHEEPRLNSRNASNLVAGNIVTVEPGVYFPGSGGIRTEDMVLVTAAGGETLSSLPKDAASAVF